MKKTATRILSILLTVFMLFGTAIPAMIFSASAGAYPYQTNMSIVVNSAEKSTPVSLTHNADNTIGDLVIHFDQKGHGDSYAKINADGTVTICVGRGDMLWFPGVQIDETSVIHVEAVLDSSPNGKNTIDGPVFDITTETGVWRTATDNCTGGMLYGGKPGFGIGRYTFSNTNTSATLGDGSYWPNRWESYTSDIPVWSASQQINYDISKTGDDVTFTFTDGESGTVITSQTYDDSEKNTYKGAVGFLSCWEASGKPVITIKNYQVSNALVNGERQDFDLVAYLQSQMTAHDYVNLAHNAVYTINGVKMEFDERSHGDSYAHINEDGTVTICVGRGDLFWMRNVEIDATSEIHVEVVMDSTPNAGNTIIGPVYDIITETDNWETATDNCTGGMLYGGKPGFGIGRYDYEHTHTNASLQDGSYWPERWQSYSSAISVFSVGQQINYDISKTGDDVTFTFTDAASSTVITSQTYDDSERNTFKGAVGFLSCWEANGKPVFTIKNYQITNALVNGVRQDFDLVALLRDYMTKDHYVLRSCLSLDGTIGLNVRVDANCYIEGTEKLVVTDSASNVIVDEALSNLWNPVGGYYVGTVPVDAKKMTDTFTVCLKKGEDVIDGTSADISVKSYAEALKASDAGWADLMDAMLAYGAAAQELFGYKTGNLAADISGGVTYDASAIASLTADIDYSSFISGVSGTLTLESDTDFNLYLTPVNGSAVFEATATDSASNPVAVNVVKENGEWKITIDGLKAEELGDVYHVTVTDGVNSVTFTYSALCWVKSAINSGSATAATKTLAKAIGAYATEAQKKTVSP